MANEPKYKVGDVLVKPGGETRTIRSVAMVPEYRLEETNYRCYEYEFEYWKLQEPVEEMTLKQVCKELGRTIKIVK